MRLPMLLSAATAVILAIPGLGSAQTPSPPTAPPPAAAALPASPDLVAHGDIISTLQGSGHFAILLKAVNDAQLSATLAATPNLTLFAPTDEAFHQLPPAQLNALMAPSNASILQNVLIYHLVHLDIDSSKIKGAKGPVQTVEQSQLQLDGSGPVLKVNDADIIQSDVRASNGIIQVIDKVLVPPGVQLPTVSAAR
jgi:uncharacterized surface protein with fasciclin (FAS1) repeats